MTTDRVAACRWHQGDKPLQIADDGSDWPCCPECSRMLETKDCNGCGQTFLDWEATSWDDIIAPPAATSDGDLCCLACLPRVERAFREVLEGEL
jgi:hypothetical protein